MPPGFTRINRKTLEEQEATRYETPANSKQSIDEELGIQDVMNITEDWYARSEWELASAVNSVLQPMEVDENLEEEASDMLGPGPGSGSPVTATEDRVLDTPGGFSRAPGDGRLITGSGAGSSGRQITGRTTEGWTRKKTVDSEEDPGSKVSQIEDQEDQSLKFDFHVNVFNIKVIVRTGRSGLTGPIFVTFQIIVSCTRLPGFVLLFAHVSFSLCIC